MSVLEYNGYQGRVSFDEGVLRLTVLHIDDYVSTECDSAAEVEREFRNLIDDYIETCRELGRAPTVPFKGSFNVRVDPRVHRAIAMAAAREDVSLNSWVAAALEEKLHAEDSPQVALDFIRRQAGAPLAGAWNIQGLFETLVTPESSIVMIDPSPSRREAYWIDYTDLVRAATSRVRPFVEKWSPQTVRSEGKAVRRAMNPVGNH